MIVALTGVGKTRIALEFVREFWSCRDMYRVLVVIPGGVLGFALWLNCLNPVCFCFLFMDWRGVDERLIRRGELLLSLDFLESYDLDLSVLNCGKVGRPYKVTCMYVMFLAVVRYLFSMPYRQLEGFTRALHRLIPRLPPIDYSWVRRRILRLDLRPYMSLEGYEGPVSIAVDY